MSYPTEFDAAILKVGDGASPEVFSVLCGIETVTITETVNTSDRFRRDCAKPGQVPSRAIRVNGKQWDATGNGLTNADQVADVGEALGIRKNYKIEAIRYDGSDTGELLGTFSGSAVMTSRSFNMQRQGDSSFDVALAGEGDLVWTPAP